MLDVGHEPVHREISARRVADLPDEGALLEEAAEVQRKQHGVEHQNRIDPFAEAVRHERDVAGDRDSAQRDHRPHVEGHEDEHGREVAA
jgi:hypothetical protein